MMIKRILSSLICIAILSGCASSGQAPGSKPITMAAALASADAAARSGRADRAYELLKGAARAHPADKAPWLRMAQMRFDDKNYGEAIVAGLAAIERDPNDTLAYSLVAVSGLRVSSKALADLTQKNGFTGSVRNEAQELANLLHATLKERIVPVKAGAPVAPRTGVGKAAPAPAAKACSGPFCGLN